MIPIKIKMVASVASLRPMRAPPTPVIILETAALGQTEVPETLARRSLLPMLVVGPIPTRVLAPYTMAAVLPA